MVGREGPERVPSLVSAFISSSHLATAVQSGHGNDVIACEMLDTASYMADNDRHFTAKER